MYAEQERAGDPVRRFILGGILDGSLEPGQKLPTERELVARFGRSRSAVRKSLTILEAEGRIVRHVGRGTFVSTAPHGAPDGGRPAGPDTRPAEVDTSPAEVMEARLVLEPRLAALVVKNATAADFREMDGCLRRAREAASLEDFERCDRSLHLAIARATRNGLIVHAVEAINRARENAEWGKLKRQVLTPERRLAFQAEHEAIVLALRERDTDLARERMRRHLLHIRRTLFGY